MFLFFFQWTAINETAQVSAQDYCREMNQDVSLGSQCGQLPQQQQQHMVSVCNFFYGRLF